jgi:hypothetical protein
MPDLATKVPRLGLRRVASMIDTMVIQSGLTDKEFAAKANVSFATLQKMRREPNETIGTFLKIIKAAEHRLIICPREVRPEKDVNLTADMLRSLLTYNQRSGVFTWKSPRPGVTMGAQAGSLLPNGTRTIKIMYQGHAAHDLAWLYVTGSAPERKLIHKDGRLDNNRWNNLRMEPAPRNSKVSKHG